MLDAVVNTIAISLVGGLAAWATFLYRRAVSIDKSVKQLNELMASALKRLDDHESRIRTVEISLARTEGNESA